MDIQQIKHKYGIVGNDPKYLEALNKAVQVAPTDLNILIYGESGVGKDIFSRIVHEHSNRKHARNGSGLVCVNCGAIPKGTIESELFGHVKGAFTGADKNRKGYFEEADGGTIFLDEVGELPLDMQVLLLRVIENGELIPVGGSTPIKVDVRIVAATNVDLEEAKKKGRFREDLYYRLKQIPIYIPPLRERKDDIPLLFRKFSNDHAEKYNMPPITLNDDARSYLIGYHWGGNIRELKSLVEEISSLETTRDIDLNILKRYIQYVPEEKMPVLVSNTDEKLSFSERDILYKALDMSKQINDLRKEINDLKMYIGQLADGRGFSPIAAPIAHPQFPMIEENNYPTDGTLHVLAPNKDMEQPEDDFLESFEVEEKNEDKESSPISIEEMEKMMIIQSLQRHNNRRASVAKELKISERTLYRKIKDYGIESKRKKR